jgi:hypothetical protein
VNSTNFVGTWKLISFETRLLNGEVRYPLGREPIGRIIHDEKGNMAVTVSRDDRSSMTNPDKTRAPLEEKGAALDSFDAYFGTYTVDKGRQAVTHHIEGALFPNWVGTAQERFYAFEDDRLELSTAPIAYGGNTAIAVLDWQRS